MLSFLCITKPEIKDWHLFLWLASPVEALAAPNNLESYKKKDAPPEMPKAPVPAFNLTVANLSYEARAKHLKRVFSVSEGANNVVSAEAIFHDNPRKSSGYSFVSFKSKKEADAAMSAFQGKKFMGRPIRVRRSRQFVKDQLDDSLQSDDKSTDSNSSLELSSSHEQKFELIIHRQSNGISVVV